MKYFQRALNDLSKACHFWVDAGKRTNSGGIIFSTRGTDIQVSGAKMRVKRKYYSTNMTPQYLTSDVSV
jgi:hypothetical protein